MKNTLLKFSPTSFLKIYLDIKFFFNNLFNNYISNDKKFFEEIMIPIFDLLEESFDNSKYLLW